MLFGIILYIVTTTLFILHTSNVLFMTRRKLSE